MYDANLARSERRLRLTILAQPSLPVFIMVMAGLFSVIAEVQEPSMNIGLHLLGMCYRQSDVTTAYGPVE